jgi:flagellar hook-basal body complex protein FliE
VTRIGPASEVQPIPVEPAQPAGGVSFAKELGAAIGSLDAQQISADQEAAKLAMGAGNLHETALALEKADIAMRLATKVRNKLVDAYQEIMRMSI